MNTYLKLLNLWYSDLLKQVPSTANCQQYISRNIFRSMLVAQYASHNHNLEQCYPVCVSRDPVSLLCVSVFVGNMFLTNPLNAQHCGMLTSTAKHKNLTAFSSGGYDHSRLTTSRESKTQDLTHEKKLSSLCWDNSIFNN